MKLQLIALTALMMTVVACGTERPNPDDYRHQGTTGTATATTKTDTNKTADASKTTTPTTMTPTADPTKTADAVKPATPPAATPAAPAAPRTVPNATELAAATAFYNASCVGCHQALPGAKKGATDVVLKGTKAKVPVPHQNITFPVDAPENLALSALVQVMK